MTSNAETTAEMVSFYERRAKEPKLSERVQKFLWVMASATEHGDGFAVWTAQARIATDLRK
jgi:hypothetical protein